MNNPQINIDHARDTAVLKLLAYYNFDAELSDGAMHPQAEEVRKYFDKISSLEDIAGFYKRIVDNCKFFPRVTELREVYNTFATLNPRNYFSLPGEKRLEVEFKGDDDGTGDIAADSRVLSANAMLKKYGYNKCREIWTSEAENMSVDEWKTWRRNRKRDITQTATVGEY